MGFPIILNILQTFLMVCVYKQDSPTELKKWGHDEKLRYLMSRIYDLSEVDARINLIEVDGMPTTELVEGESEMINQDQCTDEGSYLD